MSTALELLKQTDIFYEVPDEHLANLAMRARKRTYDPDEVIFSEGEPGDSLLVVDTGEVKVTGESPTGQEITFALLGPGDIFGELSLFDGMPRSATATATVEARCVVLRRKDFVDVLDAEPTLGRAVLRSLTGMIRRTNEKLHDVNRHPHRRIAKALKELAEKHGRPTPEGMEIDRPVTDEDLASLTGLFTVEVAHALRDFQYQDVVRRDGTRMVIPRPEELARALEPV